MLFLVWKQRCSRGTASKWIRAVAELRDQIVAIRSQLKALPQMMLSSRFKTGARKGSARNLVGVTEATLSVVVVPTISFSHPNAISAVASPAPAPSLTGHNTWSADTLRPVSSRTFTGEFRPLFQTPVRTASG